MTSLKHYRKRPIVIEGMRWNGTAKDATPIIDWVLKNGGNAGYHDIDDPGEEYSFIEIQTLEGRLPVRKGDYVLRGIKGEFYPHAGDFFHEAYDEVITEDAAIVRGGRYRAV